MTSKDVNASLARLRAELERAEFHLPAERQRVEELLLEVEGHLQSAQSAKSQGTLAASLSEAIRRFEVEHPTITACLNEIAAGLG